MKDKPLRVDPKFAKLIKEIPRIRVLNGLERELKKEKLSSRETTRMMVNTPSFAKVLEELKTMPRKEDIK